MEICTQYRGMQVCADGSFLVQTDAADIRIFFLDSEIVRLRVSFDKNMTEESYVLMTTAWPDRLDELFAGERHRLRPLAPKVSESEAAWTFSTENVTLVMEKEPLNFKLCAADGTPLYSTVPGNPFVRDRNRRVTAYSCMDEDDCFYGFGEKTGPLNKNKAFVRQRATDAMGYDPDKADTLYKHIPFYIQLHRQNRRAVGIFYHNFYESVFNMGCEKSNYWPRYSYFQADGGDLDCFLLGGQTFARILDAYTRLTGRPALLPKRALGYQGSSMYYPELEQDSDDAVLEFGDTVRQEGFPLDGFHLSSGYTAWQGKRCVFTWNKRRFKDPAAFFDQMNARHAQAVPNVKPGVLLCHPLFEEFERQGVFVRDSRDAASPAVGKWWGGDGVFWDFTNAAARDAWKKYLTEALLEKGVCSVWNDNCEYDSLLDQDSAADFDGSGAPIAQLKPLQANLMCKAGFEAVLEYDPNLRPYMVCRSGSAGIQHYAQTWCGDNYTSWQTLRGNLVTILGMGLSGQPNQGGDIGGFAGPAPSEELFVRWVQQGIFQPRFSIHSASSDNTVTEPWMFRKSTEIVRQAILLRYRFTPYLYSHEYLASHTGAPILRALVYEFQEDPAVYDIGDEYLFGRDILVANVLEKGAQARQVYLPAGCDWYDWNDGFARYAGGQTVTVPVGLDTIPMFVRQGACIAMAGNQLFSMERDSITALNLLIAPKGRIETILYDDDGVSNDYQAGVYCRRTITVTQGEQVRVEFAVQGSYRDTVEKIQVEMLAREKSPFWVTLDEKRLEHFLNRRRFAAASEGWYYSQTKRTVEIRYLTPHEDHCLTVSFEAFDLIGM